MDGQLEQRDGRWQLRFTRKLSHSPEKVWRALTEPEHLKAWFPTDIVGERVAGAPLRFVFRNGEAPAADGHMIAYDPPSVMEFSWADNETVRFELYPDGSGTELTMINRLSQKGKAARDAAGWHASLDVLGYELAGQAAPWNPMQRWQQVHAMYVKDFGPDAASIGPPMTVIN